MAEDPWGREFNYASEEVYAATREGAKILAAEVRACGGSEMDFGRAMVAFLEAWHERHPLEVWPRSVLH